MSVFFDASSSSRSRSKSSTERSFFIFGLIAGCSRICSQSGRSQAEGRTRYCNRSQRAGGMLGRNVGSKMPSRRMCHSSPHPGKGLGFVPTSYAIKPKEKTSAADGREKSPFKTSLARYLQSPSQMSSCPVKAISASPKSPIFHLLAVLERLLMMLSGLMSKWTNCSLCMQFKPFATCEMISTISVSVHRGSDRSAWRVLR
mmetsp:Transcript_68154/g.142400  ORF Transcript_68154/g.142400 Transcript_68154/m.142400 type:complete len:201 (+) Transcript_68154:360-962(+)